MRCKKKFTFSQFQEKGSMVLLKRGIKKSFFKIMMEEGGQAICCWRPWHFLNFFPLPQGQGSFRPAVGWLRTG